MHVPMIEQWETSRIFQILRRSFRAWEWLRAGPGAAGADPFAVGNLNSASSVSKRAAFVERRSSMRFH
jgi:hypothetical protein